MSNPGIGMAVHSIKTKVEPILVNKMTISELITKFTQDNNINIVDININKKELVYYYNLGKLIQVKLIFDEELRVKGYKIFNGETKREYVVYNI